MFKYEKWARKNLDVVLDRAANGEWYARCPFKSNHRNGDKNPSFGINVQKGMYYCHGCNEKGTFTKLAEKMKVGLTVDPPSLDDLDSAIDKLLGQSTSATTGEQVKVYPEKWLDQFMSPSDDSHLAYWCDERGLSEATVFRFRLGYDPLTNAATIPLRNFHGKPLGVIRRSLERNAKPRYKYPFGFKISEHLWGSYLARGNEVVAITEGSVDALACWDAGIPAVAMLGSHISDHQVHLAHKLGCAEVVVMPDRDPAGQKAAQQVRRALRGLSVSVGKYNAGWNGKDPADLTISQRRYMFEHA